MERKCNIILDSCCDLPRDVYDVPGVFMVGLRWRVGDEDHEDDLFQSVSAHEFYERIRKGDAPSTSSPLAADFERVFRACIETGLPSVYPAFSSGISGTYDAAVVVLKQLEEELGGPANITIVDTHIGSTPLGVLAQEAIRQRDRGLSADELAEWVREARWFVQTIFMVDNLEALHRGGRIPASVAVAGDKLDVKPLLMFDLDGKLTIMGAARGRKKALRRLAEFYEKNHRETIGQPVFIGNADCPKDAQRLRELISAVNGNAVFLDSNVGPTIGSHVGPGMISCCFWGDDRRENVSVVDRIANRVKGK